MRLVVNNMTHGTIRNLIALCQCTTRCMIATVSFANFIFQCFLILCAGKFITVNTKPDFRALHSAFLCSVFHVLLVRCYKKVLGIYTAWFVALMANLRTFWNWAKRDLPGKSMSADEFLRAELKSPVTVSRPVSSPKPARVSFGNFRPETLFYCLFSPASFGSLKAVNRELFASLHTCSIHGQAWEVK